MKAQSRSNAPQLLKAERLLAALRTTLGPAVTTDLAHAFLAVAAMEGQTLEELGETLGSNPLATSRLLLALDTPDRRRGPGHRVVKSKTAPGNPGVIRYVLTERGKLLARSVAEVLAG